MAPLMCDNITSCVQLRVIMREACESKSEGAGRVYNSYTVADGSNWYKYEGLRTYRGTSSA